jgi:hypothetical protein
MRVARAIRPRTVIDIRPDAQMLDRTSLWRGCAQYGCGAAGQRRFDVRALVAESRGGRRRGHGSRLRGSPGWVGPPPPAAWVVFRHLPCVVDLVGPRGRLPDRGRHRALPGAHQQRSGPGDPLLVRERYGFRHQAGARPGVIMISGQG